MLSRLTIRLQPKRENSIMSERESADPSDEESKDKAKNQRPGDKRKIIRPAIPMSQNRATKMIGSLAMQGVRGDAFRNILSAAVAKMSDDDLLQVVRKFLTRSEMPPPPPAGQM